MTKAKSAAKTAQPPPAMRMVLVAIVAVLLAAFMIYWLNNRPQAVLIDEGSAWPVRPRDEAVLYGFKSGAPLLNLDYRAPALVQVKFGKGVVLYGTALTAPVNAALANVEGENANVSISVAEVQANRALNSVGFQTLALDPKLSGLAISSRDTAIVFEAALVPNPSKAKHGSVTINGQVADVETLSAVVPPGSIIRLIFEHPADGAVLVETGDIDDENQQARLALSAFETGTPDDGAIDRRSFACGARKDTIKWRSLLASLRLGDCSTGRLWLSGLQFGPEMTFTVEGSGFTERADGVHVWPGFANLLKNDIFKSIMGALVTGLLGWAGFILRKRFFRTAPAE